MPTSVLIVLPSRHRHAARIGTDMPSAEGDRVAIIGAIRSSLVALVAAIVLAPLCGSTDEAVAATPPLPIERELPSFAGVVEWMNSAPLTAADLRGRVVVVEFWTFSCINWLRTMPYVRGWAEKYKGQGLVVVGVHTPEFDFEKDAASIRRAAAAMNVGFPIAVDSRGAVWQAFDNAYWPALYFVDAKGRIRHHQFGEGDYERSEQVIQQLLAESGAASIPRDIFVPHGQGAEAAADWADLESPENYVGYGRTEHFASPGRLVPDRAHVYVAPERLKQNEWALSGDWTVQRQVAVSNKPNGRIAYRFHARDLHLVMGPVKAGAPVRFRVLVDGKAPGADHGIDVDEEGLGIATEQRLHQLVRQRLPIRDRLFEIEFLDPGVGAYSFTFG